MRKGARRASAPQGVLALLLAGALALSLAGCADDEVSGSAASSGTALGQASTGTAAPGRAHYIDVASAGSATVMVYMCGSDLESDYGLGSADIEEMLEAELGDDVTVTLETGGSSSWSFSDDAEGGVRQRWTITDEGLAAVGDTGTGTLLDEGELADFISWSAQEAPADRYILILWDHGGGTLGGWGYDETDPDVAALSLADIRQALSEGGVTFDIVGFDACLMGTIECAYALEPQADYLVASEELEPGYGWSYTGFLDALAEDPSVGSEELGRIMVDDYARVYEEEEVETATLSVTDLAYVDKLYEQLGSFLADAEATIQADNSRFAELSQARARALSFGEGECDQVDLADLLERSGWEGSEELLDLVHAAVRYHNTTGPEAAQGLAIYFPYDQAESYSGTRSVLAELGYTSPTAFYDWFLSVMGSSPTIASSGLVSQEQSAEAASSGAGAAGGLGGGLSGLASEDWYSEEGDSFSYPELPSELELVEQDGSWVLPMTDELWESAASFEITVLEEYEDGYVMLGSDNVYDVDEDGNIVVSYDGTWLALGGEAVSFYCDPVTELSDGTYACSGTIPALLNGETRIDIYVWWDLSDEGNTEWEGEVLGYRKADAGNATFGKGYESFAAGDVVEPLFDVYDADGNWTGTITGASISMDDTGMKTTYEEFEAGTSYFWGTLTTVYGSAIDTETLVLE